MDQLLGVRTLIDRLGLPPRLQIIVSKMEEADGPLDQVGGTPGAAEVRRILGMVDGQNLMGAIVACLCNHVELDEEIEKADARALDRRTSADHWQEAADTFPDQLVLLSFEGNYLAFDGQAERIAGVLEEHLTSVDRHQAVVLSEASRPRWEAMLLDAGLDVLLVSESDEADSGYVTTELTAEPDPVP